MLDRSQYGWRSAAPTHAHAYLVPAVLAALPPGRLRIVDLGSGNGFTARLLADRGNEVVGVEPSVDGVAQSPSAIETAGATATETSPGSSRQAAGGSVRFVRASVYDDVAAVAGTGFDVAISTEVIEHLDRPRELFRAARSVLKPGGTLIVTTPHHGYLKNLAIALVDGWDRHHAVGWDGGHVKFFSVKTLSAMAAEAGFTGIRFRFAGRFPPLPKSMCLVARAPAGVADGAGVARQG